MIKPPTISVIFDRRGRASSRKTGSVELSVYFNKRQYRIITGVNVYADEWSNGRVVLRRDCIDLNKRINKAKADVEAYALRCHQDGLEVLDASHMNQLVTGEKPDTTLKPGEQEPKTTVAEPTKDQLRMASCEFCDWLDRRIEQRDDIKKSTRKSHKSMAVVVRESGLFNTFADLTTANIKLWDDMLHNKYNRQTTIHGFHKRLKHYINEAVIYGFLSYNPYLPLKIKRGVSESRKFLRDHERIALENLRLEGGHAKARDMFIFSCYTGLSYSDMIKISKEDIVRNGDRIEIIDRRQKTGSPYRIILLPKARAILEGYNYNMKLLSSQKCNAYLKTLALKAGIKINLTMHVGRHTFATWCLRKGIRIEIVSKMLAHADITTTQIYAKILQEDVESGYEQLMGT